MDTFQFVQENTFEKRKTLVEKIKQSHPHSIPVIVETTNKTIGLQKSKFIVPFDIRISQLMMSIRKHTRSINAEEGLFLMTLSDQHPGSIMLVGSQTIQEAYEKYQSMDGFLYIRLEKENVFGV